MGGTRDRKTAVRLLRTQPSEFSNANVAIFITIFWGQKIVYSTPKNCKKLITFKVIYNILFRWLWSCINFYFLRINSFNGAKEWRICVFLWRNSNKISDNTVWHQQKKHYNVQQQIQHSVVATTTIKKNRSEKTLKNWRKIFISELWKACKLKVKLWIDFNITVKCITENGIKHNFND